MPCKYVLQRGPNKGKPCGRGKDDYCKTHATKQMVMLSVLPTLVINNIVSLMCNLKLDNKELFGRLQAMYGSCKDLAYAVRPVWKTFYEKLDVSKERDIAMKDLTYLQRLHLLLDVGCQKCGTPRITKIYWPLPVRVCSDCIRSITVNEFALSRDFMVKSYNDNRFMMVGYYGYNGEGQMKVYLKKHVESKIGCALIDAHLNDWKRRMAEEFGISTRELATNSVSYVKQERPSIVTVSREYYSTIAMKQLPDARNGPVVQYRNNAGNIKTKESYDSWIKGLPVVLEAQRKHEHNKMLVAEYEAGRREIRCLLGSTYFSKLDVKNIPGISGFFKRREDETVDSISQRMKDAVAIVKRFVENNLVVIDTGNQHANGIANSMLRYPDKTPDPKQFVTAYAKSIGYEVYLVDLIKTESWDEALVFVKNSKEKHSCEECNLNMKHKEYLKHMYLIHGSDTDLQTKDKIAWYSCLSKTDLPKLHGDGTLENTVMRFVLSDKTELSLGFRDSLTRLWVHRVCEAMGIYTQSSPFVKKNNMKEIGMKKPTGWKLVI